MTETARDAVADAILTATGGRSVDALERLTGGASRETWRGAVDGEPVVAQRQTAGSEHDLNVEAGLLRAAAASGVPVPRVIGCAVEDGGAVTLVTDFVPGETIARRLLRDDEFAQAREVLVVQLARALARVHRIPTESAPALDAVDIVSSYRERLDELGEPHPAFELAFRWLEAHRPGPDDRTNCVVHGDFRLGNVIVDGDGLAAVIDWELAHLGHPLEDLGWACVPAWRFGSPLPAAGVGTRTDFLAAYNDEAGTAFTLGELRWWEVCGILRWGVICMSQADRHLSRTTRSHELAAIGRRVCENEHDLFLALEGRW